MNDLSDLFERESAFTSETQPLLKNSSGPAAGEPVPEPVAAHTVVEIKTIQTSTEKLAKAIECNNCVRCVSLIVFIILLIIAIIISRHQIFST